MTSDEKYIKEYSKRQSPFVAPKGYLENLTDSIVLRAINAEVAKTQQNMEHRFDRCYSERKKWLRFAASVALLLVGGLGGYLTNKMIDTSASENASVMTSHVKCDYTQNDSSNIYVAPMDVADCAMLDNDQIYSLVASN